MEALRKVALAYYDSGTDEERRLFNKFFQAMDQNGSGMVSYTEFFDFMSVEAHDENMRERPFFNQLDIDGSGRLDFKEVMTLYYILKSRRPICGRCKIFITKEYFTCMRCFETGSAAYSICLECFRDKGSLKDKHDKDHKHDKESGKHKHDRSHFVDNFSLLESLRKKPLPNHQPSSRSSGSPSNLPIVPYESNTPAEGRGQWQAALSIFEAALSIAAMVGGCSIL